MTARDRRAVALISLAVIAILVVGLAYLHSSSTSKANPPVGPSVDRTLATLDFVAYDFASPSIGWALDFSEGRPPSLSGLFWVFRTTDRGVHWQKQLTGQAIFRGFGSLPIQVIDQSHVFVLVRGVTEELYRTVDGGTHWTLLALPRTQIEEVEFSDARTGWLLTQPTSGTAEVRELYTTGDAGDTWYRLPDVPTDAYILRFRSADDVWMSGYGPGKPHVYTSNDAGQTWRRHELPPPPGASWDVGNFLPATVDLLPGIGVTASVPSATGSVTFLFVSFDQGITWRYLNPPPGGQVGYQDAYHWWAMGSKLLFKSSDAGQTWSQVSDKLPDWQFDPQILDSKHAWAALSVLGGYGLAFSDDAGIHWTRVTVPQPA